MEGTDGWVVRSSTIRVYSRSTAAQCLHATMTSGLATTSSWVKNNDRSFGSRRANGEDGSFKQLNSSCGASLAPGHEPLVGQPYGGHSSVTVRVFVIHEQTRLYAMDSTRDIGIVYLHDGAPTLQ